MRSQKNNSIKIRAFAKINLTLKVTGKRNDGFHDIDSVMQSVSLHDEVDIKTSGSGIKVKCSEPAITDNIAQKAAELFLNEAKIKGGVDIFIKKNIPLSAGLAGGSSDAAATLFGINKLFNVNFHRNKLIEIGATIGSDVPFCLVGGTARCTGRGEKVEKINPQTGSVFILVIPKIEVPTKLIYDQFDKVGGGTNDNDLEKAAVSLFPDIGKLKESLNQATGKKWRMSGSGPALFLELMDLSEAEKHTGAIQALGLTFHVVKRMDQGMEEITQ